MPATIGTGWWLTGDAHAGLLAAGFALHSMGIPLTTVALFTLLGRWAAETGTSWWAAGALAAASTVAGHGAVLLVARLWGPASLRIAARYWPRLDEWADQVDRLARTAGGWGALTVWRWAGPGFAQAFWVLCALPRLDRKLWTLLGYLTLHDILWSYLWTYALVVLHLAAPVVAFWLDRLAWALLVAGLGWAAWTWWRRRWQPSRPHPGASS